MKPAAPASKTPARSEFDAAHPKALAIYCSDGRFTDSVEELLRALGHARLDTLTIPGGPGLFNLWSTSYSEREAILRASKFLVEGHRLERAVLLAHAGCGFYRTLCGSAAPNDVRARQVADLLIAARHLAEAHPRLAVEAYYATVEGDRVKFERVPLEG